MPGEIDGEKKLDAFRKSDIFVLPSYIENSPISIIEAMRAGLPVISTTVGAIPEIILDNENGFIGAPGDTKKFTEKILLLAKNVHLRNSMAHKNLQIALNKIDPQSYSINLMKIYDRILYK